MASRAKTAYIDQLSFVLSRYKLANSNLYSKYYTAPEIILEHERYGEAKTMPVKFDGPAGFPYINLPSDRDFERLLYCIYAHDETMKQLGMFYDTVTLMQGGSERGRDLTLTANGLAVGLVQAKQYASNLSRNALGQEIIKFVLHATQDEKLIPPNTEKFHYYIAVSCGLAEKAMELINEINTNTLDDDELKKWVKFVVRKNSALSTLTYEAVESELKKLLAVIHATQVIPTDLDVYLSNPTYSKIIKMFFHVSQVIDPDTFKELLVSRESEKVEFNASLSLLEKKLQQVDEKLFTTLTEIKKHAFEYYNEYGHQCLAMSNHRKVHHQTLIGILSTAVLGSQLIGHLNKHELFVLAASAFLTDVGICANFEVLEEQLEIVKGALISHGVNNQIRDSHHQISANRIRTMEIVPEQYRETIALVAGVGIKDIQNLLSYPNELSIDPYDREKVCIPLLSYSLLIADMIDVHSLTSGYLFAHHQHLEGIQEAIAVWEEAPPKLRIETTDDGKRLQLLGEVSNQLIHLGLLEHLKSVQLVLSRAHESLRKQTENKRLDPVFADYKIDSKFFGNFGFSVATENVLATFIEKSMYTNEFMALRELIQNAIDSCLLRRRQSNSAYRPKIQIQISNDSITASDNGMGMDRHDVEFYFSRLGRSFYKENAVTNSIGQFGVGVFAYFMISDSFEVTTKDYATEALSFVASPSAPYCFYFSPNTVDEQGTTVKLNLKSDYRGKVGELADYIISTFKHTAIPISVEHATSTTEVLSPGFLFSKQEIIKEFVKPPFRRKFDDFTLVQASIDLPAFAGTCGIFNINSYDNENFDLRRKSTGCKVFQNGVFVCTFSNLVGEINIKQPLLLKANREGFNSNEEIQAIISQFQRAILKQITPNMPADNERVKFTRFYLYNYDGNGKHGKDTLLLEADLHSILVAMEGTVFPFSYHNLSKHQQIGLIHVEVGVFDVDHMVALSSELKIPFVCVAAMMDTNYFRQYLKAVGFCFEICNAKEMPYLLARKDVTSFRTRYSVKQCMILPFNDRTICSHLVNLGDSEYLNSMHPILRSVEDRFDELGENRSLAKAAETFFETLVDQLRNVYPPQQMRTNRVFNLTDLQHYLDELNHELETTYSLSLSDFPTWMHDKIVI